MQFHQHFFRHDHHIILSSQKEDDTRLGILLNKLAQDFPNRRGRLEARHMDVEDVISIAEIKPKVENLLLSLADHEVDIFFSPGTSAMQLAWYLCHTNLGLKTRLLQTRPPKFNKGQPELLEMEVEQSTVPVTAILKERLQGKRDNGFPPFWWTVSYAQLAS